MSVVDMRAQKGLLSIQQQPLAMSKSKVVSRKAFAAPPLRKAQSSPSMAMLEEPGITLLPPALQQQLEEMRGDAMPERWMCVARREKINYAVGRIIQVGKKQSTVSKDSQV